VTQGDAPAGSGLLTRRSGRRVASMAAVVDA